MGAASLCLAVLLGACGPAASSSPAASATASAAAAQSPATTPTSTVPARDRLAAALQALASGYTFDTLLSVGGKQAARVTGRRLGTASELTIDSGGVVVTYRIIPPQAWLRSASGEWAVASDPGSSADPLAPLLAPLDVTAESGSQGGDQLDATYPAAALGLGGTDPVKVRLDVAADGTVTVRYETQVGTQMGVSQTVLRAAPTQDPIVAPSPLPSAS
ncbi:MAG: hypothetical protein HY264_01105 [Chloroflexi bacterium]|nr:hypothetical protein [Chloroflexota bacterium]